VWLAWAAPGVTAYLLLVRVLGHGVTALPGALVVLTLSAGVTSGVEGGVHVGMVAARLGWALLPLLLWVLAHPAHGLPRTAPVVIPLLAALVLMHPAHVPMAVVAVGLAALAQGRRAWAAAAVTVGCGPALTAFWSVPLIARLAETRALAWGSLGELLALLVPQPLVIVLVLLAAAAPCCARTPAERLVARFPWVAVAVVAVDALVFEPLGLRWLPADRIVDGAVLGIVLGAGFALGRVAERVATRTRLPVAVPGAVALALVVALSLGGATLTLWPTRAAWPTLASVERGLRLGELWVRLSAVPEGRVLFTRSGVPLVYGTEWWRPHTHVTALAPRSTGRGIVHGTFTHPSPIAALLYRGDAGRGAITSLVERLDGHSLFGRPLGALDAPMLDRYADVLGVSTIVALDEDVPRLPALDDAARFRRVPAPAPFAVWVRTSPVTLPQVVKDGVWRVDAHGVAGQWIPVRMAYYPLWQAFDVATPLAARRGTLGDLEIQLARADATIELRYGPGTAERAGVAISAVALIAWAASVVRVWRTRNQPASA
jgi:hypothetical protein